MRNKALYVHTETNSNPQNHNYVKKLSKLIEDMQAKTDEMIFVEVDHPNVPHTKGFVGLAQRISNGGKIVHANIYHSNDCHIRNNGWCTCDPDIQIE